MFFRANSLWFGVPLSLVLAVAACGGDDPVDPAGGDDVADEDSGDGDGDAGPGDTDSAADSDTGDADPGDTDAGDTTPSGCNSGGASATAVDCFPECGASPALAPASVAQKTFGNGGVFCGLNDARSVGEGAMAGIGYSGVAAVTYSGREESACIIADLGSNCNVGSDRIFVQIHWRPAQTVCGDSGTNACVAASPPGCGANPTIAEMDTFMGNDPENLTYTFTYGQCITNPDINPLVVTIRPAQFSIPAVRYIAVCRPFAGCDANAANLEIDGITVMFVDPPSP